MSKTSALYVEGHFDPVAWAVSYNVVKRKPLKCATVDSVFDGDLKSGHTRTPSADRLVQRMKELGASVQRHSETRVYADHFCAAAYLRQQIGASTAIGSQITAAQKVFGKLFDTGSNFARDDISKEEFVPMGNARDRTLDIPVLTLPSAQVNTLAGELPPPQDNSVFYIKVTVDAD